MKTTRILKAKRDRDPLFPKEPCPSCNFLPRLCHRFASDRQCPGAGHRMEELGRAAAIMAHALIAQVRKLRPR